MDDPPLTKTFEIYEKVVVKSPNGFTVSLDGVHEITPAVGEVNSVDGWFQTKRDCQRNLQFCLMHDAWLEWTSGWSM
ncbi:hypothetical protein H5410_014309 [Solanum commersonii]|uniref:Uncharacterized protein n=1 Tax=Solanum commersonii TaxID=4109 RepID=A0A9J5ZQJ7_SOLCO|nr:hypothetical protein H5410_014309 [Solanum commersonii]